MDAGEELRRLGTGDAAATHARAVWHLLWSPRLAAARSAARLDELAFDRPVSDDLLADRVAAHLVAGLVEADPRGFAAALEAAGPAGRLQPKALAFNRALALELLGLTDDAAEAWGAVARHETDRAWSVEAKSRAAALERLRARGTSVLSPARRMRQALEEGLGEWAAAVGFGDRAAGEAGLRRLRQAQEVIQSDSDDRCLLEIEAGLAAHGGEVESLAAGVEAYLAGLSHLRAFRFEEAAPPFAAADQAFEGIPPLRAWSLYQRAVVAYQEGSEAGYRAALRLLEDALEKIDGRACSLLRGRIHYQAALTQGVTGRHAATLAAAEAARSSLRAGGDPESLSRLEDLVGSVQRLLGQRGAAWSSSHRALREAEAAGSVPGRYSALFSLATLSREEGWHRAEAQIADALVQAAEQLGQTAALVPALKERARARHAIGEAAAALDDLDRAANLVATVADLSVRAIVESDLRLVAGEILLESEPAIACRQVDEAVDAYRGTYYRLYLPAALRMRSRCGLQRGDMTSAADDLAKAIAELERQRAEVADAADRISFYDEARLLFGEQVDLLAGQGRWPEALLVAEQSRARSLLDRLIGRAEAPEERVIGRLTSSLLPSEAVVAYFITSARAYAWVLTREELWGTSLAVPPEAVVEAIRILRQGIAADVGSEPIGASLARLHGQLVQPLEPHLEGRRRLFVILDGATQQVPFSSLVAPASRRYLFEDREVYLTPSLAVLNGGGRVARRPARGRELVVAAGAPPGLPRLVGAPVEARRVAALLDEAELILDAPGEARAALADLVGVSGLHFVGHVRASAQDPRDNGLLLSDGSVVDLLSIASAEAPDLGLVVLSACGTARGPSSRSEGPQGLARAFLAAGASSVVASLWDVNDRFTAEFMIRLHEELREGGDAAEALRRTKRWAMGAGLPPATWAAFEVYSSEWPANPRASGG